MTDDEIFGKSERPHRSVNVPDELRPLNIGRSAAVIAILNRSRTKNTAIVFATDFGGNLIKISRRYTCAYPPYTSFLSFIVSSHVQSTVILYLRDVTTVRYGYDHRAIGNRSI